ncbi:MAG: FAD-binding protein, partial [Sandarakinorhabdus sp.]
YPVVDCDLHQPGSPAALLDLVDTLPQVIARGNGRAYGDASLNPAATIGTLRLDRLIDLDPATGAVTAEAGLLLKDLIAAMLPRGWFAPVTPGTKFVTIGGMIASDVHGKNHHGAGSFCDHVEWLDLALGDGRVLRCSPDENADLFAATCGGMGLTGIILRARFRLLKVETSLVRQRTIRAPNLADAFAAFESTLDWTYSVAWIDCLAQGRNLGRSAIILGEHALPDEIPAARRSAPLARPDRAARRVPIDFPTAALSRPSVQIFNKLYYARQVDGMAIVDIDPYFYPLDALLEWNRIYGAPGFVQYQCVLPLGASEAGMTLLLRAIAAAGQASFLAVLKRFGKGSFGLLSFPMAGYTLALDFPANAANFALLERLDAITRDHGGRIYLAKDARTSRLDTAGYPDLERFRAIRQQYGLETRFSSLQSQRLGL